MSAGKIFGQRVVRASKRFELNSELLALLQGPGFIHNYKIRQHPCKFQLPAVQLPERLDRAAIEVLKEVDLSPDALKKRAQDLGNYLWKRPFLEEQDQRKIMQRQAEASQMPQISNEDDLQEFVRSIRMEKRQIMKHVSKQIADFQPMRYDSSVAPVYLVSRLAPNFAVNLRVLLEIQKSCPDFNPRTLYDFGSGLGTVMWAANALWPNSFREIILADTSSAMLNLSEKLLRGGSNNPYAPRYLEGVFTRQFLSASPQPSYDLVTCSSALLDLGMSKSRRVALETLWRKTEGFLILIEQGTAAGFKAILEARDFLIQNFGPSVVEEKDAAHLFAPCPHAMTCPKEKICNFSVTFKKFNLTSKEEVYNKELFSYVIFSKGPRKDSLQYSEQLSRVVSYKTKSPNNRSHIHDVCTAQGNIERVDFLKKDNKVLFTFMKKAKAGDLVPTAALMDEVTYPDNPDIEDDN